jgi:nucleoside-diphosphate-sugar epimerase
MEQYVRQHPRYLIIRLPQIAGKTSNSNALLNYLYSCISREETFKMWIKAKRNIISVDDVVLIVNQVIEDKSVINATINIANPNNYSMPEIIQSIENVTGKRASYEIMDSGDEYIIETVYMKSILSKTNVVFCKNYLENALREYYKQN